jgi:alpha-galactosidase
LWFSVPFVGYYSKNYDKFKGKYLKHQDDRNTSVLDPRFKDVRKFLVNIYASAVKEYGYDGLKLDFIDEFALSSSSSTNFDEMDCRSVEEGLSKLLKEITTTLKKINPEIIIEFRQSYVGPFVGTFGNIFRVVDCPADAISNRIGGINLRLTSGETAVHSDMITWNVKDSNESVLYQLFSSLFIVPQISVRLAEINEDHKRLLKNFLSFWLEHQSTLLDGELKALNVDAGYTLASSETDQEKITVVYNNQVIDVNSNKCEFVFNATGENFLFLQTEKESRYIVYDYFGNLLESGTLKAGLHKLSIPNTYLLKLFAL